MSSPPHLRRVAESPRSRRAVADRLPLFPLEPFAMKPAIRITVLALAAALAFVAGALQAADAPQPPFALGDPARIAAGKTRFGATCAAYCHGSGGVGGRAP